MKECARRTALLVCTFFFGLGCGSGSVSLTGDADVETEDGDVETGDGDVEQVDPLPEQDTWYLHLYSTSSDENLSLTGVATIDSGEIFAIGSLEFDRVDSTPCVVKLDSFGNVLWAKFINIPEGIPFNYYEQTLEVIGDEIFIAPTNAVSGDMLIKLNTNGDFLEIFSINRDFLIGMNKTSDDRLLLVSSDGDEYYITKLDSELNVLWDRSYDVERFSAVFEASNGDIVAYGMNLILRLNPEGEVLWSQQYTSSLNAVVEISSGELIAVGVTSPLHGWDYDAWIGFLDSQGDILWSRKFGIFASQGLPDQKNESFEQSIYFSSRNEIAVYVYESVETMKSSHFEYFLTHFNGETREITRTQTFEVPSYISSFFVTEEQIAMVGPFLSHDVYPGHDVSSFVAVTNTNFEVEGACSAEDTRRDPTLEIPKDPVLAQDIEVNSSPSTFSLTELESSLENFEVERVYICPEGDV